MNVMRKPDDGEQTVAVPAPAVSDTEIVQLFAGRETPEEAPAGALRRGRIVFVAGMAGGPVLLPAE